MAKRIAGTAVNWASLAERVPAEQRVSLQLFKQRSDGYLRRVLANPPEPPKIDWVAYKNSVPIAGMVDNFQKNYSVLKIDYPKDNHTAKVEAQWAEVKNTIAEYCAASKETIAKYEKEIAETQALLPYDQMTMEDFRDAYPDEALDPINRPSFWPHNPEEQLDYVDPDKPAPGSGH